MWYTQNRKNKNNQIKIKKKSKKEFLKKKKEKKNPLIHKVDKYTQMDNLEMLHEFFNHCNDPKTPKIRTRLISLLYQYQQIIWLQKNEGGTIELAYLKKELSQIVQNEYSIKLSSFERKLKEDLGLKVKHKKNIYFFFFPKWNSISPMHNYKGDANNTRKEKH